MPSKDPSNKANAAGILHSQIIAQDTMHSILSDLNLHPESAVKVKVTMPNCLDMLRMEPHDKVQDNPVHKPFCMFSVIWWVRFKRNRRDTGRVLSPFREVAWRIGLEVRDVALNLEVSSPRIDHKAMVKFALTVQGISSRRKVRSSKPT